MIHLKALAVLGSMNRLAKLRLLSFTPWLQPGGLKLMVARKPFKRFQTVAGPNHRAKATV